MKLYEFEPPFQHHQELNPKIWDAPDQRMKGEVRGALLRMAQDFIEFVGVPVQVQDVVVTGGMANYNYSRHSDIDLHVIADMSQVECDRAVDELFDTKRLLYKKNYDLTIHKIPVELYIENSDMPAVSQGEYSVTHDGWLRKPTSMEPDWNPDAVEHWVRVWRTVLKKAEQSRDLHTLRTSVQLLKQYRRLGLRTANAEFSTPNLVYKSLRNDQTLIRVLTLIDRLHVKHLSI
jgi:hypothetical protein